MSRSKSGPASGDSVPRGRGAAAAARRRRASGVVEETAVVVPPDLVEPLAQSELESLSPPAELADPAPDAAPAADTAAQTEPDPEMPVLDAVAAEPPPRRGRRKKGGAAGTGSAEPEAVSLPKVLIDIDPA